MNICTDIYNRIIQSLPEILKLRNQREIKEDNSYVTRGDLLCQEIIIDCVNSLDDKYQIISEEMNQCDFIENHEENYVIIDPIDGTENFTSGLKEWGISVCFYRKGKHFQSMLAMPELNAILISGDRFEKFNSRICGLSSSLTKNDLLKVKEGFEYRIIGCAVYNLYNVIRGSYASFENFKGAKVWDIIAGLNIAIENGLEVIVNEEHYRGEFLRPDSKYRFRIQQ